jgi:hypothetical protein
MRYCASNRNALHACLFFPFEHPYVWLSQLQPHTHACESFNLPCTGGPTLTKSLIHSSVHPLLEKEILTTMQEDPTTKLTLVDPESAGSISQNLQISPQNSRPLTLAAGTNEMEIWALQLYIVPLPKLPRSFSRASCIRFSIRLWPQDQDPTTYSLIVPEPPSILIPRGAFFSNHT